MNTKIKFHFFIFPLFALLIAVNFLYPKQALASMLFLESAQENIRQGETFTIDWFLDTEGMNINSMDLLIGYSQDTLELVDIEIGNSLVSLWIREPSEVKPGVIRLVGGVPGGIKGSRVPIFHSTFKSIKSGQSQLVLLEGSGVLLNDGQGSEDSLGFKPVVFSVMPAAAGDVRVFSLTHPNPLLWYSDNNPVVEIEAKNNLSFSYSFSSNVDETPNLENVITEKKLKFVDLNDGVYYLKLAVKEDGNHWRELPIFTVRVDSTPPEDFSPMVSRDSEMFGNRQFLVFSTVDKASGIAGYFKKDSFGRLKAVKSPLLFSRPWFAKSMTVLAQDRAGNIRTASIETLPYISQNIGFGISILLVAVLLFIYKISRTNKNEVKH